MAEQNFKIKPEDLSDLVPDMGYCFATNMITVEGFAVGLMYREESDDEDDSGWRFFSGYETEEYLNNEDNTMVYDVNTIANYDTTIIPFLRSNIGAAYEREPGKEEFSLLND